MSVGKGDRLGPYEIIESLGAGGMGEVWRARDTRLDRDVAIKILPDGLAQNEEFVQRFEREAKSISSLNHPHICTLHDVGEADLGARSSEPGGADGGLRDSGRAEETDSHDAGEGLQGSSSRAPSPEIRAPLRYLVMELLEGESLAERLQKGPLPLHETLRYGRQIASALDAAHRREIVHRDLKPGNIMLTKSGAKLLDFGLAKGAEDGASGVIAGLTQAPTEHRQLTQEGTILGTFQYMAPEQLEGLPADARSDIFALGAVLYEMATGKRAFEAESKTSLIAAIVSSQPEPISQVTPMTPPALDHVVRRCLEKDPDDRWQSAHDIASELHWISEAGSQAGVATPISMRRKSRERLAWTVAGLLLVALITLMIAWFPETPAPEKTVVATITPPAGTALIPFDTLGLALSPDGERLAFVAIERGEQRIWIRDLGSNDSVPVAGTEDASYPFWSPDAQHLGFFAQGKLKRVDLRGGAPQVLAEAPSGRGADWGEDDRILYAPNIRASIFSIPASGGTPVAVTDFDPEAETTHRWPVFLPDGDHFLYVSRQRIEGIPEFGRLMIASLDGGDGRVLIEDCTNALYVPGYLLFGKGNSLFAQPFDLKELELGGRASPIVDRNVSHWEPKNLDIFTASDDGTIVYLPSSSRKSTLEWYDRSGRPIEAISEASFQTEAVLSPDGTKIAVIRGGSAAGPFDLWIHDLEHDRATRVTFGGEAQDSLVWSPKGDRLVFSCSPKGVSDVCVKDLDRAGDVEVLVATPNWSTPGSWGSDGRLYYTDQNPETNQDIHVLDPDDEKNSGLIIGTPFVEDSPRVSPDGRWLAFVSNETGPLEIFLRSATGSRGQWQVSRGGGVWPRWSRSGREIYYLSSEGMLMAAGIESTSPVQVGEPRVLFELPGEPYSLEPVFQDVSADGERILLNIPTESRSSIGFQVVLNWTALVGEN